MKTVILAGGLGTRLAEETQVKPKPMVEIGGKPMLWHLMNIYAAHGFCEFIVALGYKGECVKDYFLNFCALNNDLTVDLCRGDTTVHRRQQPGWRIHLVDTGPHTETGGRIKRLEEWIGGETFMLTYGDGVSDINIGDLLAFHKSHGRLHAHPEMGLRPVACLDDDGATRGECAGVPVAGPLALARALAKSLRIHHALVAMPGISRQDLLWMLDDWGAVFRHVILVPDLSGVASLWAAARDLSGVLGLELRQNLLIPFNRWTKRALDIAGALVLGILALPVVAAAAVWIKWSSAGSATYCQEREGKRGRSLRVFKLRTMHRDADALLMRVLASSPEVRAEWSRFFKLKKDPRILPGVGKFLRRTSLDELPQLWSVMKGEMSLVGPRPLPDYHLDGFGPRFRTLRNRVKPGLTGLWQVSDRADGDLEVLETLDTYYIRNWSLWLDLYILARTVRAVLFPKGAY